jgi:hypothetical protein
MAIQKLYQLHCDGDDCYQWLDTDPMVTTALEAKQYARSIGWAYTERYMKLRCPECKGGPHDTVAVA